MLSARLRGGGVILWIALPTLIPVAATLAAWRDPFSPAWQHVLRVLLPDVAATTLALMLIVMSAAGMLGTALAWLTARYDFAGRAVAHVALLLPLALPGYVLGFVVIAGLDYAGPLQSLWREWSGGTQALWQIRGFGGAATVLTLTLYPYVYLTAYNAFRSIAPNMLDMAATMDEPRIFRRIALPLARPWIIGGMLLVGMEVLADFGTVSLFNVATFTTAIYRSWYGLFALEAALQLASFLVIVALGLMWLHSRAQGPRDMRQTLGRALPRVMLRGTRGWSIGFALALFVSLLVGIPIGTLAYWSGAHMLVELDARYLVWLGHSLQLALMAALMLCTVALLAAYLQRRHAASPVLRGTLRLASMGYALPGTLLAVGLFAPAVSLENALSEWIPTGWLTQSLLLLLLAYWARFLAVAQTPVAQQLARISPSIDEASRQLGVRGWALIMRVHRPLVSGALFGAAALLIIDIIKEMPMTLMLRPAGFDTLATRVFELTAEGEYQRAALPALTIVLAGLIPVILLLRAAEVGTRKPSPAPAPYPEAVHVA